MRYPDAANRLLIVVPVLSCVADSTSLVNAQDAAPDPGTVQSALDEAAAFNHRGAFDEALETLRAVEQAEPDNPWLWFYRGSAYAGLDQPYRALECFDRARAILEELGNPEPELAAEIHRRRRDARREIIGLSLSVGPAYDSNVSFGGAGAESLGLVSGRGDWKLASGFALSYAPIRSGRDSLIVGARIGNAWYAEVEAFNFEDYSAGLRYTRTLSKGWEASIAYEYAFNRLGHENFLSNHLLTTALSHSYDRTAARWQPDRTTLAYQLQFQDFLFEADPWLDRDGVVNAVALEHGWLIRPIEESAWTCDLRLGYRFESTATEGTEFDNFAHDFNLGLAVPIVRPWDPDRYLIVSDKELIFRFDADWWIGNYRNRSRIDRDRDPRSDLITTCGFTLSQTLADDPDLGEVILHAIVHWTDADSNVTARGAATPFTYEKVVYGLQVQWSW